MFTDPSIAFNFIPDENNKSIKYYGPGVTPKPVSLKPVKFIEE